MDSKSGENEDSLLPSFEYRPHQKSDLDLVSETSSLSQVRWSPEIEIENKVRHVNYIKKT